MKREEVEETIKGTINYSNSEIKKNKRKILIFSIIIILIVIIMSVVTILFIRNEDISAITDKDTLYEISEFIPYQTTIEEDKEGKLENILGKLALSWKEQTINVNKNKITIKYDEKYKDIIKAYGDEEYVKEALIYNYTVLYTMLSDLNKVEYKFKDISYSVTRNQIQNLYSVSNLSALTDEKSWNNIVSKNIQDKNFVNDTFDKLFK